MYYGPCCQFSLAVADAYEDVIAFDLGYWDRGPIDDYAMRMTINHLHPQAMLDLEFGPERWDKREERLRDCYDPDGPVLVIGLGPDSARFFGFKTNEWELSMVRELRHCGFTNIIGRPKVYARRVTHHIPTVKNIVDIPIHKILRRGASLVVTHHSNVGVEAIMHGIPVATIDGAARAVYPDFNFNAKPIDRDQALTFLRALAWFNWRPSEAAALWRFLRKRKDELFRASKALQTLGRRSVPDACGAAHGQSGVA